MEQPTKTIFCAHEQSETPHKLEVVEKDIFNTPLKEPEIIASCTQCGRQLKFPATVEADELISLFDAHKQANEGQQPIGVVSAEPAAPATPPAPVEPAVASPETQTAPDLSPSEQAQWNAINGQSQAVEHEPTTE